MFAKMKAKHKNISIHALRGEGDLKRHRPQISSCIFQSTPSVGRATLRNLGIKRIIAFQSTPSVGRATWRMMSAFAVRKFQSTPSVGRATLGGNYQEFKIGRISIHALRGEGDH